MGGSEVSGFSGWVVSEVSGFSGWVVVRLVGLVDGWLVG